MASENRPLDPNPITTHILDTASGLPASGVHIILERSSNCSDLETCSWEKIGETLTNADGRGPGLCSGFAFQNPPPIGVYKATFYTQVYFERRGLSTFYPKVEIIFRIVDPYQHYHIPLLLSPYGYSTYRGS